MTKTTKGAQVINTQIDGADTMARRQIRRGTTRGWQFYYASFVIPGATSARAAREAALDWFRRYEGSDFFSTEEALLASVADGKAIDLSKLVTE